jgi:hypothetical protein
MTIACASVDWGFWVRQQPHAAKHPKQQSTTITTIRTTTPTTTPTTIATMSVAESQLPVQRDQELLEGSKVNVQVVDREVQTLSHSSKE